jgi:hypothetical protein
MDPEQQPPILPNNPQNKSTTPNRYKVFILILYTNIGLYILSSSLNRYKVFRYDTLRFPFASLITDYLQIRWTDTDKDPDKDPDKDTCKDAEADAEADAKADAETDADTSTDTDKVAGTDESMNKEVDVGTDTLLLENLHKLPFHTQTDGPIHPKVRTHPPCSVDGSTPRYEHPPCSVDGERHRETQRERQ